ncbi:DoxX family protein [Pontibacter toksunensis]|uniref:DoxX family protein n=1 Tax=Pontibacter toksunensis TaxID=1332631 RepID=A0ABW6C0Z4_9BACT
MIPLIVLLGAFAIISIGIKYFTKENDSQLAGRIAMSVMLLFTASGHFAYPEGMALMIPDIIPYKREVVFLTGIIEIAGAVGLLVRRLQVITAWLLILFFIMVLPANIHAAIRNVDYQTGPSTGPGINYLWFRVPLQLFFIAWTYFFAIRRNKKSEQPGKRTPAINMRTSVDQ